MPAVLFSASLLIVTALGGTLTFEPDWNTTIPVDAFLLPAGTAWSAITLELPAPDNSKTDSKTEAENKTESTVTLTLKKNTAGILEAFPLFYKDTFFQITTLFAGNNVPAGFAGKKDEVEFKLTFLEYSTNFEHLINDLHIALPEIARITIDGAWYFISFAYQADSIIETWFNETGDALCQYKIQQRRDNPLQWLKLELTGAAYNETSSYAFDSFGNKIAVRSDWGSARAVYNDKGVRYLERRFPDIEPQDDGNAGAAASNAEQFEQYEIHWTEQGVPDRTQLINGNDGSLLGSFLYQYRFDAAGNWIERETSVLTEQFGTLLTANRTQIRRSITY